MKFTGSYKPSRLKFHFEIVLGKMLQPSPSTPMDKERPYLRAANVLDGKIDVKDLKVMWFSPKELNIYELKPGDLLVLEGGDVGRCAIWNFEGEIGFQNSLHRLRPFPGNSTRFALYWFKHLKESGYFESISSKATLAHYTSEKVKETPFPNVDFHTQKRIADFLDRETARIDELIEKKQRLVELLEEQRTAILTQTISGPSKVSAELGSGLYDYQQTWKPVRLKYCVADVRNGAWGSDAGTSEQDVVCIRVADLDWQSLSINLTEPTIRSVTKDQFRSLALKKGDILLEKSGGGETTPVGRTVMVTNSDDAICSNFIARIRPSTDIVLPKFLLYIMAGLYLSGYTHQFIKQNTGIQNLDQDALFATRVQIPSLDLQELLIEYLKRETTRLESIRVKTNQSIELLRELRSALITAAVTGQIDVDEWERRGEIDRRLEQLEAEEARAEEAPL